MEWVTLLHTAYACACLALVALHGAAFAKAVRRWGWSSVEGSIDELTGRLLEACGAPPASIIEAVEERISKEMTLRMDRRRHTLTQIGASALCACVLGAQLPIPQMSALNQATCGQAAVALSLLLVSTRDLFLAPIGLCQWYALLMVHTTLFISLAGSESFMLQSLTPTVLLRAGLAACCPSAFLVSAMNCLHLMAVGAAAHATLSQEARNLYCTWEVAMLPAVILASMGVRVAMRVAIFQQMEVESTRTDLTLTAGQARSLRAELASSQDLLEQVASVTLKLDDEHKILDEVPRLEALMGLQRRESVKGMMLQDFMPVQHDKDRFARQLALLDEETAPHVLHITLHGRQGISFTSRVVMEPCSDPEGLEQYLVALLDLRALPDVSAPEDLADFAGEVLEVPPGPLAAALCGDEYDEEAAGSWPELHCSAPEASSCKGSHDVTFPRCLRCKAMQGAGSEGPLCPTCDLDLFEAARTSR